MQHIPVLLHEAVDVLCHNEHGFYIDGTFGRGGHSQEILTHLSEKGRLLAIDCDPSAVAEGKKLCEHEPRLCMKHGFFSEMKKWVSPHSVDGILLDLGVSSLQLDTASRGFSFLRDGPLDMRMNQTTGMTAAEWIASASKETMAKIFWLYGEERYSRRIAHAITEERKKTVFDSTLHLASVIKKAHPRWQHSKHPATKVFQAIRIHINQELEHIKDVLQQSMDLLKIGGRLVVISFHSLEDRLVKKCIQNSLFHEKKVLPRWVPVVKQKTPYYFQRIGRIIKASASEVQKNSRARSAVMRIAEKRFLRHDFLTRNLMLKKVLHFMLAWGRI